MPPVLRSAATASVLALVVAAVMGCTATRPGATGTSSGTITSVEMDESGALNAYDAVQRLRPRWLQVRGGRSITMGTRVLVYYDDSRLGDVDALRQISLSGIDSIDYLDSAQASAELPGIGSEHVAGAIVVRTRPAR